MEFMIIAVSKRVGGNEHGGIRPPLPGENFASNGQQKFILPMDAALRGAKDFAPPGWKLSGRSLCRARLFEGLA